MSCLALPVLVSLGPALVWMESGLVHLALAGLALTGLVARAHGIAYLAVALTDAAERAPSNTHTRPSWRGTSAAPPTPVVFPQNGGGAGRIRDRARGFELCGGVGPSAEEL